MDLEHCLLLPPFTRAYNFYVRNHHSEPEVSSYAGSVAVLPAYLIGVILFISSKLVV
ncbi:MAG: hypothetical protein ABIL37_00085 [candidate division WOR-3 bacterium]